MSVLGNRVVRREDPRFLRGEGAYVENLDVEGALHITFVRSLFAHARITVDASDAKDVPGVHVFTAEDVELPPFGPPPFPGLNKAMGRPMVAQDVVRFVGDIVAIVLAESRAASVDAAELVYVDYDPLPAVVTPQDAAKDETLLFPEAGTNVAAHSGSPDHDDDLFDGLRRRRLRLPDEPAAGPVPARAAVCRRGARRRRWSDRMAHDPDAAHGRGLISGMLGLEPGQVRVISPDVGGGFGAKLLSVEEVLVAWLAKRLERAGSLDRDHAVRTWSRSTMVVPCGSTSRSAARVRASCSPFGSRCCRTPAPTR